MTRAAVRPFRTVAPAWAALIDVALVVVFAAVGRGSHGENVLGGLAGTAWPFLLGLLVGWLVGPVAMRAVRHRRFDPVRPVPGGVVIWTGTWAIGMLARAVTGQGVAPSFLLVAGVVLALFLLGWRFLAVLIARRRPG